MSRETVVVTGEIVNGTLFRQTRSRPRPPVDLRAKKGGREYFVGSIKRPMVALDGEITTQKTIDVFSANNPLHVKRRPSDYTLVYVRKLVSGLKIRIKVP